MHVALEELREAELQPDTRDLPVDLDVVDRLDARDVLTRHPGEEHRVRKLLAAEPLLLAELLKKRPGCPIPRRGWPLDELSAAHARNVPEMPQMCKFLT